MPMGGTRLGPAALMVLLAACGDAEAPEQAAHPREIEFSAGRLRDHAAALAHDSMCGRGAGSPYERSAAAYIEQSFLSSGLAAGGPGGYRQAVPLAQPPPPGGPAGPCDPSVTAMSQNVLGVLRGQGPLAGQWVIVGAHYDHLGWRVRNDQLEIFNGADDNASGTVLLLETARLLAQWVDAHPAEAAPRRSIMFQAYGAEELGLVGSTYFVAQPTVPADSIVAMLNLDMVGRLRDGVVELAGLATSPVWPRLVGASAPAPLKVVDAQGPLDRSDHAPFHRRGVPVLHFFTGLHPEYHTTRDDVDLLELDGMTTVGRFLVVLLWAVATEPDPP
jgi:hypothetical protein